MDGSLPRSGETGGGNNQTKTQDNERERQRGVTHTSRETYDNITLKEEVERQLRGGQVGGAVTINGKPAGFVRVEAVLTNFSFITTEFEKTGGEP